MTKRKLKQGKFLMSDNFKIVRCPNLFGRASFTTENIEITKKLLRNY